MKKLLCAVVFLSFAIGMGVYQSQTHSKKAEPKIKYVPGEVIVKLKPGATVDHLKAFSFREIATVSLKLNLFILKFSPQISLNSLLNKIRNLPQVEYAEPNYIYSIDMSSFSPRRVRQIMGIDQSTMISDPEFEKNWGLNNVGQTDVSGQIGKPGSDIDALQAWTQEIGSRAIKVAVIDTGIDYTHEDLVNNIYQNPGELGEYTNDKGAQAFKETDGIDNDGNGFIDDVRGWNFVSNSNDAMDDHSHGTHVAGTIGAYGNNEVGILGVTWRVSLIPVKFLSSGGSGTLEDAVKAIEYAHTLGVHVMSNSWGGGGFSQALADAIKSASDAGIYFVAAAGNDAGNNDVVPHYPSNYEFENVISVAATDNQDQLAKFSNYGKTTVDIAAPGVSIYSSIPGNNYGYMSGTSMATPHISGMIALLLSSHPNLAMQDLKKILYTSSEEIKILRRKISHGRANAFYALTNFEAPKSTPTDPSLFKNVTHLISTPHDYDNSKEYTYKITHSGAKKMRVHFSKFETETGYDFVYIKNAKGEVEDFYDGVQTPFWTYEVDGDTIEIVLAADQIVSTYGFDIDSYGYVE
ncbi:MAG: S8 family serine peptidase [Deltaproteobacteria bacterium]|nr:S8 family serine peptidase [Deltaproteobacteria bacterium]